MSIMQGIAIACGIAFLVNAVTLIRKREITGALGWICAILWIFNWWIDTSN